ncbi:hypothetical protein HPB47_004755 [Ixodes persulcatus]|uniref:Uncharacterized protein n=1 Tax=Ixodes persulcatus TaxID=34615 RepID=A0AC60PET3_IXOPE|nr:hypothetical protein HPB47_004755 [Ixodes persulcatus]
MQLVEVPEHFEPLQLVDDLKKLRRLKRENKELKEKLEHMHGLPPDKDLMRRKVVLEKETLEALKAEMNALVKKECKVEAPADCWRHPLPLPRDARKMKGAPQGTVTLSSQFSHEDVQADGAGPSPLRMQSELDPSVLEGLQARLWGLGICAGQKGLKGRPVCPRKPLSVQPPC